jgi:uncharacterized protein (DUF2062 family)
MPEGMSVNVGAAPWGFVRRKVIDPVMALLKQGVTPKLLAISLAIGIVVGIFPIVGTTTVICVAIALGFRLNVVAMQVTNHLVYPLQLLLLIPFVQLGERLFGAEHQPLSLEHVKAVFALGAWHGLTTLSTSLGHAVAAWALTAPVACLVCYVVLRPILERSASAYAARTAAR